MLDNAWIIPLIPAASFFLILAFGKRLPRKGSELGIAAVGIAFVLALVTNVQWFQHVSDAEHESETHTEESDPHAEEEAPAGGEEHGLGAVTVGGESAQAETVAESATGRRGVETAGGGVGAGGAAASPEAEEAEGGHGTFSAGEGG